MYEVVTDAGIDNDFIDRHGPVVLAMRHPERGELRVVRDGEGSCVFLTLQPIGEGGGLGVVPPWCGGATVQWQPVAHVPAEVVIALARRVQECGRVGADA